MDSIHTSHALLWYVSSLYSDGVARVFTASQERKASPDQIAVSSVVKSVGMLVKETSPKLLTGTFSPSCTVPL